MMKADSPTRRKFMRRLCVLWLAMAMLGQAIGFAQRSAQAGTAPTVVAAGGMAATPVAPVRVGLLYNRRQATLLAGGSERLVNYVRAITDNGGTICALSPMLTPAETGKLAQSMDALLVPGGDDVAPCFYGEKPDKSLETTDPEFDLYESNVVSLAEARGLPILGICRGHQFLNVWAGGTLWQDLPTQLHAGTNVVHRIENAEGTAQPCYHDLNLKEGTFMFRLFKTQRLKVNSYHHQGVKVLAPRFHAVAWTDDGLVEAFEDDSGKITGVQFHPEKERALDPAFNCIFSDFIQRAGAAALSNARAESPQHDSPAAR
jgi:putative glutamine amidotransferase